jgi:TetR/AcrR family transcriptional repressor of lmrAB and yxaGH operons
MAHSKAAARSATRAPRPPGRPSKPAARPAATANAARRAPAKDRAAPRESAERERTSKGARSRQRLIEATAALLRKQGFHGTGLAEIVQTSGAPRGSLYFYFPGGKEELACAALAESGAALRGLLGEVIDRAGDVASAVEEVCQHLAASLAASGWEQGCPLATVALEASADSSLVRQTCAAHFQGWMDLIAERLTGAGMTAEQARPLATFALSTIEGALLLAKVQRDPAPLLTAGAMLRRLVTARLGGASSAGDDIWSLAAR